MNNIKDSDTSDCEASSTTENSSDQSSNSSSSSRMPPTTNEYESVSSSSSDSSSSKESDDEESSSDSMEQSDSSSCESEDTLNSSDWRRHKRLVSKFFHDEAEEDKGKYSRKNKNHVILSEDSSEVVDQHRDLPRKREHDDNTKQIGDHPQSRDANIQPKKQKRDPSVSDHENSDNLTRALDLVTGYEIQISKLGEELGDFKKVFQTPEEAESLKKRQGEIETILFESHKQMQNTVKQIDLVKGDCDNLKLQLNVERKENLAKIDFHVKESMMKEKKLDEYRYRFSMMKSLLPDIIYGCTFDCGFLAKSLKDVNEHTARKHTIGGGIQQA